MSAHRDIKLDKYEISKNAYRELLYFCLQYPEKKRKLEETPVLSAAPIVAMVKGGNVGNPTEKKALKSATPWEDCVLIESTAIEAGASVYTWILKAVTLNMTWELLQPPMGRRQFYECRRRFFFLLAFKKGMI